MKKHSTLKASLFLGPSFIMVGAFAIVLIAFNVIVTGYSGQIASEHIESRFSTFSFFNEDEANWEYKENESGYGLDTRYVILDESEEAIYPCEPWINKEEELTTDFVCSFYRDNREALEKEKILAFKMEKKDFRIQMRTFYGYYDGYLLFQNEKDKENHTYKILVFTDITPIMSFGKSVSIILCGLLGVTLIFSLAITFIGSIRLDRAFRTLDDYIAMAGSTKKLPEEVSFTYDEFQIAAETVRNMRNKINQAENVQKQFFSNASHELKTPLMSIQGYAEGLQSGVMKDQEKCLSVIVRETQKMAMLINDILLLSRMDAANTLTGKEPFDLCELLRYCVGTIETAAAQKSIVIRQQMNPDMILMNGDESGMEHALLNILTNALRYATSEITVVCRQDKKKNIVSITDDGQGISEKDLPHIFERFYKGEGGNFGIGLSITKEVIELHQGEIVVDSMPGKTEFRLILPQNMSEV